MKKKEEIPRELGKKEDRVGLKDGRLSQKGAKGNHLSSRKAFNNPRFKISCKSTRSGKALAHRSSGGSWGDDGKSCRGMGEGLGKLFRRWRLRYWSLAGRRGKVEKGVTVQATTERKGQKKCSGPEGKAKERSRPEQPPSLRKTSTGVLRRGKGFLKAEGKNRLGGGLECSGRGVGDVTT